VRINPEGLFEPGESRRAMMPATNPITMIQRMPIVQVPIVTIVLVRKN
jgi:hypothetical protein